VEIYTGRIQWPTGPEPHDGGFGPSYNIAIMMDDPSAPKSTGGVVRLYRKVGHDDVDYICGLAKGDPITLGYMSDRGGYTIIKEARQPSVAAYTNKQLASLPPPVGDSRNMLMQPQPPGNMKAWEYIAEYMAGMYQATAQIVATKFPSHTAEQQQTISNLIMSRAMTWWRPGLELAGNVNADSNDDQQAFLTLINPENIETVAESWLDAVAIWHESDRDDILTILTRTGITSGQWLGTPDGQWNLCIIVGKYIDLANGGMVHADIVNELNQQFGLELVTTPAPLF